jgi:hypothetical protein
VFPNVGPVQQDVAPLFRSDSGDSLDSTLVFVLHPPQKGRSVSSPIGFFVQLLVALVTHEHQVADVIELIAGNAYCRADQAG